MECHRCLWQFNMVWNAIILSLFSDMASLHLRLLPSSFLSVVCNGTESGRWNKRKSRPSQNDRNRCVWVIVRHTIVLSTVNLSTTPVYPCQCAYVSLHNASVPTSPCTTPVSPVLLAQVRTLLSSCSGILFLHDTARTFSLPGQPVLKFTRLTTQCLIETY